MRGVVPLLLVASCAAHREGPPVETAPQPGTATTLSADAASEPARVCSHDATDPRALVPCNEECDRGIPSSCALLAGRFERGDGIAKDLTRAATLHERACELRDALACVSAARMHAGGHGVPPNRGRQIELLVQACHLGDGSACNIAARALASGAGVPKDERRAAELVRKACAAGIEAACEGAADGP